jgi:hypothetical protein
MNFTKTLTYSLTVSLVMATTFVSCIKKDDFKDTDVAAVEENAMAESDFSDVNTIVDGSFDAGTSFNFRTATNGAREQSILSGCGTVTVDTVSATRRLTINFGSNNCLCVDGKLRRGTIIATWTGKYRDAGTVINVSFDNYFVNDNQIRGTHKTTNVGRNNSGSLVYKVEVDGQVVKAKNAGTFSWKSTRQREWLTGYTTPLNVLDDSYSITGSATGITAAGENYSIVIKQALVRKMNCRWIESGKIEVTPQDRTPRSLDFGSSGCDANATVTIGLLSIPIVLP